MARIYQLRIYDTSYTTLQETINDEALISGSVTYELSGEESLRFQIDHDHADFSSLALGKVIELYHTGDAEIKRAFRVVSIIDLREESVYKSEIYCEGLKYDLNKRIFQFFGSIIEQTPTTHLTEILAATDWTVGTVTPSTNITIQYNYDTVLNALEKVRQATGYDLEFTLAGAVNLKAVGNAASTSTIEFQKNLKSLRREQIIPEATKVYGVGGEGSKGVPMTIGTATHRIINIVSNTIMLDSNKILSNGGEFADGNYAILKGGTDYAISVTSKEDSDEFTLGTVSGLSIGDKVYIATEPNIGLLHYNYDYFIDTYGVREMVFRDENFSDAINLLGPYNSSALSGTYTAGVCEGWTAVGSPTLTENTDTNYVINGTKSQKVVVSAFSATPSSFDFGAESSGELNGAYNYKFAWVTIDGEGPLSSALDVGTATNQRMVIELLDSPHALALYWRIYRTKAGGGTYYFVADVDVSEVIFIDTLGDDKLTVESPGNTAAGGQGVQRTFTAVNGDEYSSLVWIYVVSGRVRVELEAGTIIPEKELGTNRATPTVASTTKFIVKTEGLIATNTAGKIRIVAHEGAATFYVDSAGVFPTAYAPNSDRFVSDNDATQLWYATYDELQRKKVVGEKISLTAVDLYETAAFSGQNLIEIGDTIEVIDAKLGVDTFVRVVRKIFDLLQPWNAQFEVSASPLRFTSDYADRLKREKTIGTSLSRQASKLALANRNLLGSSGQPVVEIMQIES